MIIIVDALNKDRFGDLLDEMFKLRARVFGDRLGWEVEITNGREIDQFDRLDPAYVIGLDDEGHVVSCVRALQTTGPHMLSDVFQVLLDGEPPLRSATLWESTRFCVDTQRLCRDGNTMKAVSMATCELMIGSLEYARRSGISDIITVIDPVVNRVLKRSDNAPYDYVGSTKQMGKVPAMAALLDCTEERINRVRAFAGITHDVFANEDTVRDLLDARQLAFAAQLGESSEWMAAILSGSEEALPPVLPEDIQDYCRAQIETAQTEEEHAAALRLVAVLVRERVHPAMHRLVFQS
ncbi:autoinducer synthase [Pseudotabrizicola sediminis]|uniref:Acyl-homoserine-lactone synthase n=1 Tax=Pseudotabrizicola sediminis TaxID=2486418 RepID=A0ABY2KR67_9RHOB|nr:acyl-homoserine-lactone synthase [Pseudotabrizicola sediminis]TGD43915.1 autoinducer synthase [Pseudotabrizicola sediminis]TGD65547.1 autoinducer synthase [Tabrizicola sp. WMC-M-20]